AICGASVVYLAIDGNNVGSYEEVRSLANSAVDSVLEKIDDNNRKEQVLKVMPENKEITSDQSQEELSKVDIDN
ncbi:20475_t:CDS:2, partial [Racocetra persica]